MYTMYNTIYCTCVHVAQKLAPHLCSIIDYYFYYYFNKIIINYFCSVECLSHVIGLPGRYSTSTGPGLTGKEQRE